MRGTKLNFGEGGISLDWSAGVRDFDAVVQNALVNVGTDLGSDDLYPSRGTTLKKDGAAGRMVNSVWANHAANFAALKTLAFIQQTGEDDPFLLRSFRLQVDQFQNSTVSLTVQAISLDGQLRGNKNVSL